MRKLPSLGLIFAALLAVRVPAAFIDWNYAQITSSPTNINTTYTVIGAESALGSGITVNGVTFDPLNTANNISINYDQGGPMGTGSTFDSGDANFNTLLQNGFTSPPGQTSLITFTGLTIGHQYQIQFFTPVWNTFLPTAVTGGDPMNMVNEPDRSTYIIGTFTANSSSQSFGFKGQSGGVGLGSAVILSSITAIPEPSTYAALAGLAVFAIAALRRRRPAM